MNFYLEWHGCSANKNDAEIVTGILEKHGFKKTNLENADFLIIFTCIVKEPTHKKMIYRIQQLQKTKKPLIIAGCFPEAYIEELKKIAPNASFIGPFYIDKILEVVKKSLKGEKVVLIGKRKLNKLSLPSKSFNEIISIIQISSGCLMNCSYCATKIARGNLFSYSKEEIIKKIREELFKGKKEFWLTSQDNSCYGLDRGYNLASLLKEISTFKEKFFVRNGMLNPTYLKFFVSELIEAYKDHHIFKFLHLCVQSGSNKVLEDMKRGYKVEDFLEQVKKFRKEFPCLTLSTDIIVGYPTETEEDFEKTLKLIEKVQPDIVNISKFFARPKTEAAKLKPLPHEIIKKRSKILTEIVNEIKIKRNERWIGWEGEVLVDERGKNNSFIARNFAYKPIVIKSEKNLLGKFVDVEITEIKSNFLIGKIV